MRTILEATWLGGPFDGVTLRLTGPSDRIRVARPCESSGPFCPDADGYIEPEMPTFEFAPEWDENLRKFVLRWRESDE